MKFKIEIEITLTEEDVDKIMKVALEEGIGYWFSGLKLPAANILENMSAIKYLAAEHYY